MFNVALIHPEIPQNTGNIGRSVLAWNGYLHLVKPIGFSLDDRYLRRAGLDYWDKVKLNCHDNFDELREKYEGSVFFYATTKAAKVYTDVRYGRDCFIVFGKETAGLPEDLLEENRENCIRIPMMPGIRSLNLSNSAAVIIFEALRQTGFGELLKYGEMGQG